MAKKMLFLLTSFLFATLLLCSIFAAETTVYVGAKQEYTTLESAIDALNGKGGTVVICDTVTVSDALTVPEQSGDLTITANGGALTVTAASLSLAKNENGNRITFDTPITTPSGGLYLYGGFNSIHFTENFEVTGKVMFYGGVNAATCESADTREITPDVNLAAITTLPYDITVDNGIFSQFAGGNRRSTTSSAIGSIAAPLTVTVNGGTFTRTVSYNTESPIKNAYMFSLSGMTMLADDATLTVNGGRFEMPLYVHGYIGQAGAKSATGSPVTYSDAKYYAADGDVVINILGGTFTENCIEISAEQTTASYNPVHRGNMTVSVSENATFLGKPLFDATQVKAYANGNAKSTLNVPEGFACTVKRFDVVNGEAQTYTEPLRIACIGDSITEGVGAANYSVNSYPARLLSKIAQNNKEVILSNYGNSGSKTVDYEGRWYNHSLAYVLSMYETDADYVLIGLGTNDARMTAYTYGYAERFHSNYTDLLRGYGEQPSTKVVFNTSAIYRRDKRDVATVCNVYPMQKEIADTLNAKAIADGKDVRYTFVDLYALSLEDFMEQNADGEFINMNDTVHPNDAGYIVYADILYDALFNGKTEVEGFKTSGDLWVSKDGTVNTLCTEDSPTSNLAIALSRAADGATLHVVGKFDFTRMERYDYGFCTPTGIKNFSIVGEGDDATLTINSDMFFVKGDLFMDNITLGTSAPTNKYAPVHICLGYNNVTLGEGFKTLAPNSKQGGAMLIAGAVTVGDNYEITGWYNSPVSVAFTRDCAVEILGGSYVGFVGGNYPFPTYSESGVTFTKPSIFGSYSGDMTLHIGKGVALTDTYACALNGFNYLTGTVNATVDAWADGKPIYTQYSIPEVFGAAYNENNNTGSVKVTSTVENTVVQPRDFNGDGSVNVADVIFMVSCMLDGSRSFDAGCFYGRSEITLLHVIRTLKALVR